MASFVDLRAAFDSVDRSVTEGVREKGGGEGKG